MSRWSSLLLLLRKDVAMEALLVWPPQGGLGCALQSSLRMLGLLRSTLEISLRSAQDLAIESRNETMQFVFHQVSIQKRKLEVSLANHVAPLPVRVHAAA